MLFGFQATVSAETTEAIDSFDVNVTLNKDSSLEVVEKIVYNFGSNQRHGIFRDIPLTSQEGPTLNIKVGEVKNEAGRPINTPPQLQMIFYG
jgi:hypothetical protein